MDGIGVLSVLGGSLTFMTLDDRRMTWLLASQHEVLSRVQASASGLTASGIRYRLRKGGPWRRLLPGVYLTTTGQPTWEQWQVAALLYAGRDSLITGRAALLNYGIRGPKARVVDVLVPVRQRPASVSFVVVHRTWRMPPYSTVDGFLRFVPAARAVADAVRGMTDVGDARTVVASAVQQDRCTIAQLGAEVRDGPVRGSALLRSVLAEVADGVRSPAEAQFRRLVLRSCLPRPLFNPELRIDGAFLARPDAWWPDHGVAAEVDSREWHILPADWEATMARHRRMSAAGVNLQHFSPGQVRKDGAQILDDLDKAIRRGRPVPGITTIPAAARGSAHRASH